MALDKTVTESTVDPKMAAVTQKDDIETSGILLHRVGRRLSAVGDEISQLYAVPPVSGLSLSQALLPVSGLALSRAIPPVSGLSRKALKWGIAILWYVLVSHPNERRAAWSLVMW